MVGSQGYMEIALSCIGQQLSSSQAITLAAKVRWGMTRDGTFSLVGFH